MTYDTPGRARKNCPQCGKYVHVRSGTCDCGFEFKSKKVESVVVRPRAIAPVVPKRTHEPKEIKGNIKTPAGKCPHKFSFDSVAQWIKNCLVKYNNDNFGSILASEALKYWVRMEFGYGNPNIAKAETLIDENYNEVFSSVSGSLSFRH